jgi:hypothetical protein
VRDFALREADLRSLALYFEVEAGEGVKWQSDENLGLLSGTLRLPSGRVLRLENPESARRGRLAEFVSTGATETGDGRVVLRLETRGDRRLYLRGLVRTGSGAGLERLPPLGRVVVGTSAAAGQPAGTTNLFYPEGRCTYPLPGPPPTRRALLAKVYSVGEPVLGGFFVMGGLLLGLGLVLVARGCAVVRMPGIPAGIGVALAMAGLSLPAVVLVVPYHGTDESRHVLSYARCVESPGLTGSFIRLGEVAHAEPLKWQPDAILSAALVEEPDVFFIARGILDPRVIDSFVQDYRRRAPALARVWRSTASWVEGREAGWVLLAVRGLGVLLSALLVGGAAAVLVPVLDRGAARWLVAWPLFLFPLPVLFAGVTNYSVLVAAGVLTASCLARLAMSGGESRPSQAAVLGLALGLQVHLSLNSLPLLAAAVLWLAHRPVLRGLAARHGAVPGNGGAGMGILQWWAALWAGFAVTRAVSTPEFSGELVRVVGGIPGGALPGWIVAEPLFGLGLACVLLGGLEVGAARASGSWIWTHLGTGLVRASAAGSWLAVGLVLNLAWFTLSTPPALMDREKPWRPLAGVPSSGCPIRTVWELDMPVESLTQAGQVREVFSVFLANLSLRPADQVLVRGFWAGLLAGEVRVPAWVSALGILGMVGGWVRGAAGVGLARSARRTWMLLWSLVSLPVALAGLAIGYWPRNLYGRYAAPFMMGLLAAAVPGWKGILRQVGARWSWVVPGVAPVLLMVLHGTWVLCVVTRFFGG